MKNNKTLIFILENSKIHIIDNTNELDYFSENTTRGHLEHGTFYFYNSKGECTAKVIDDLKHAMETLEDTFHPLEYCCGLGNNSFKLQYICSNKYN